MKTVFTHGAGSMLQVRRQRGGPLEVESARIDIGTQLGASGHFRISSPPGWRATPAGAWAWQVWPQRLAPDETARVGVQRLAVRSDEPERNVLVNVETSLDLTSDYDPAASALLVRNRASELGEYRPQREVFEATWPSMPAPFARVLFEGLYSDVVFLSAGPRRGGLCSGMARWSLARSLGVEPPPASTEAAIQRIARYHGRQLRDRALLSALPWFLRGSPVAAFRAVRNDLLRTGMCDRALDLAVPKLWRRDVASALVAEGHTVVPYRLQQRGKRVGAIEVYDPNHPSGVTGGEPRRIEFDLSGDRYKYGTLVTMEQSNVGIIAVRQRAYMGTGTAILATLGSLVLDPKRGFGSLFRRAEHAASKD